MKGAKALLTLFLAAYTALLLAIELRYGQDHARHYFTDITGPVAFYAVNTTLSQFLLWGVALLFAVCRLCVAGDEGRARARAFYASQALIFFYLGLDERFMLHELFGELSGRNDAWFVLGVGGLELAALYFLGDIGRRPARVKAYLFTAATLFAVMNFIDVFLPDRMLLRLSLEDLAKFWSGIFLFLFAWEACREQITELTRRGSLLSASAQYQGR